VADQPVFHTAHRRIESEPYPSSGHPLGRHPLDGALRHQQPGGLDLLALHRAPLSTLNSQLSTRIYIPAGIHGDEPAGPDAGHAVFSVDSLLVVRTRFTRFARADRWAKKITSMVKSLHGSGRAQEKI